MELQQKIAYFDTCHNFPEEMIMAAGFTPYKILGKITDNISEKVQFLTTFFCPSARKIFDQALKLHDLWAGIIIVHGCEETNRQYDIWKKYITTNFLYWFNPPKKTDPTGMKNFKKELILFQSALEAQYKIKITNQQIQEEIKLSNKIKTLLKNCALLRQNHEILNSEYFELMRNAVQMSKKDFISHAMQIFEIWQKRPEISASKKRIYLTGTDLTQLEWMKALDEANLQVVGDDLTLGSRYYSTQIPIHQDPFDALNEYYTKIPRPTTQISHEEHIEYLLKALEIQKVDGIIAQNLEFCKPYSLDMVHTIKHLKEKGFKVAHLENHHEIYSPEVKTKLEAFRSLI